MSGGMMSVVVSLSMLALVSGRTLQDSRDGVARRRNRRQTTCDPLFSALTPDHTMCRKDSPNSAPWPLTQAEIKDIVDEHNRLRAQETSASCMPSLVWDEDLAEIAEKQALQCKGTHDTYRQRRVPKLPGVVIGQNAASGQVDFMAAVTGWHNEISRFQYGIGSVNGLAVGHYTQIVNDMATRIGCGRATCINSAYPRYYYCNYARGQLTPDLKTPFCSASDPSCPVCLSRDAAGLGECGKVCVNGGTLRLDTCTCICRTYFSGASCETFDCPTADPGFCLNATLCGMFSNWPYTCPYLCNTCPTVCGKVCQNGGTQNTFPCLCSCPSDWTGDLCETPVSVTPSITTTTTSAIPTTTPPIFTTPCFVDCLNGGHFMEVLCTCACPEPYSGTACETCEISCLDGDPTSDCTCQCRDGYSGDLCDIPPVICINDCLNGSQDANCNCQCHGNWAGPACDVCSPACPQDQTLSPLACVCIPDWVNCYINDSVVPICRYIDSVTERNLCTLRMTFMNFCPHVCKTCLIQAPTVLPRYDGYE